MPRNITGSPDQRKAIRVQLLASTDWLSIRHRDQVDAEQPTSLTADQYSDLLAYRQALRDWPVSGDYGEAYPVKPGWLNG